MQMVVVAIYDNAAGVYARPVFVGSKGLAVRSFQDECRRPGEDNPMHKHPEDFKLFMLGTFDDVAGSFQATESGRPVLLFNGSDCK